MAGRRSGVSDPPVTLIAAWEPSVKRHGGRATFVVVWCRTLASPTKSSAAEESTPIRPNNHEGGNRGQGARDRRQSGDRGAGRIGIPNVSVPVTATSPNHLPAIAPSDSVWDRRASLLRRLCLQGRGSRPVSVCTQNGRRRHVRRGVFSPGFDRPLPSPPPAPCAGPITSNCTRKQALGASRPLRYH